MKYMRKLLALALTIVVFVNMIPVVYAQSNVLTISTSSAVNAGDEFTASVNITSGLNASLLQFAVAYDSSKLELVSAQKGAAFTGLDAPTLNASTPGKVFLAWETIGTALNSAGSLIDIRFRAKSGVTGEAKVWIDTDEDTVFLDYGYEDITPQFVNAALTVSGSAPTAGYNAAITCGVSEVTVGDSVSVNVDVSHDSKTAFAASEVKLSYDASKLSFNESASTLNGASVTNAGGVLTLENYGADKNCGTGVYVLSFTATANGSAAVNLTFAAFSDKEGAVKSDLTAATLGNSEVNLTVKKKSFAVTLPDIFTGATTVTDGESYTFTAKDTANYTYALPTATIGGASATVTDNVNGTYTVANVTGALVISGSRTPKSYTVTFAGNAASDVTGAAATATYGTDYSFTKPTATGWAYNVEEITVGGTAYTGYSASASGNVYTIPGAAITGDVVITVNKSQTVASVTVVGSGAGAAAGYEATANIGSAYSLTITPVAGYDYTVTATMGGSPATLAKSGNTYTIASVTGNIVFTVEQFVVTAGVSVSKYLTLDGTRMWLVKNETTLASGSVATYDGQPMFVKGGVYCTLVIANELKVEDVAAKVGIATGTAVQVSGMDVNMSGKVDANDAQLTYNMYNVFYNAFTDDVTVEKFLRADVNGDGVVNVADAAAIISEILK